MTDATMAGTSPTVDLLLEDATIITMNPRREVLATGYITVTDGRISAVGTGRAPPIPALAHRRLTGGAILPGFVNTHDHLVSSLTRGLGGDRFLGSGDHPGRAVAAAVRSSLDEEAAYAGARVALGELLVSGVTTTTDSQAARRGLEGACDGTLRALTESGMNAVFFRASVDRTEIIPSDQHDTAQLAVVELDRLRTRWASDRIVIGAEAMALHRVSPDLLRQIHAWASEHQAPFAMHISYSREAAEFAVDEHGERLLCLLDHWGILDHRFVGYHPVWLDAEEIELLGRRDAGVSLCSAANMLIGVAAAPLDDLLAASVRVGLGTDQPNDGHNFFEVMKATILHQRSAQQSTAFGSPELALEMATIGGARSLHLENEVGSIEVGKRADLVVLAPHALAASPAPARISNIVYAAGPADIAAVLVGGREVVRDGSLQVWSTNDIVDEADAVVRRAAMKAGLETPFLSSWPVVGG